MQSLVVDQWINMAVQGLMAITKVILIVQQWEWQMDHLTLIHLKIY